MVKLDEFIVKRTVNGKIEVTNLLSDAGRDSYHTELVTQLTPCKRLKKNPGSCYGKEELKDGCKIVCRHCGKILGFAC